MIILMLHNQYKKNILYIHRKPFKIIVVGEAADSNSRDCQQFSAVCYITTWPM